MEEVRRYGNSTEMNAKGRSLISFLIKDPEKKLPEETKKRVFAKFYPVALSAFNQTKSACFGSDVYNHLFKVGCLVLVFDLGRHDAEVAFRTFTVLKHKKSKILYIEGTAIKAEYQGLGIYQNITKLTVDYADFVVSRTQNPIVVTALSKLFGKVYPIMAAPNKEIKEIAFCVSQYLKMSDYEKDLMIGRRVYGGILTGTFPNTNNGMNEAIQDIINPEDGDCFIAVCPA